MRTKGAPVFSVYRAGYSLIFLAIWLTACSQSQLTSGHAGTGVFSTLPVQTSSVQGNSAEWVVLIDNSRSIRPAEQVLIREATMLLADLAEMGDRISVITFGNQANLAASVLIQNDPDRRQFQNLVRTNVNFNENFSDIRSGLRLLAEQRNSLFSIPNAHHAAILLTDGLLEPSDHQSKRAFQEIQDTIRGKLQDLDIFSIALGETGSLKTIPGLSPPLTGLKLLENEISRRPELFTHAKQLDQVPDTILRILKSVNGTSLPDSDSITYRIDQTVEKMTLIVRKRTVDGKTVAEPRDIQLIFPEAVGAAGRPQESNYRNSDYKYFDLFTVHNPRPGEWRVALSNGNTPLVLSKIDTPIQLHMKARPGYYLNESSALWAWLWDDKQKALSHGDYKIQAHIVDNPASPPGSYLTLEPDSIKGQYFLELPESIQKLSVALKPDTKHRLEIKATRADDPMFLRQAMAEISLVKPLIAWKETPLSLERMPFTSARLEFGGILDTKHPGFGSFNVPPSLNVVTESFDENAGKYIPITSDTIALQPGKDEASYTLSKPFTDDRRYRYRYELTGNTSQGEQVIRSHWYGFELRFPWLLSSIAIFILLSIIHLFGHIRAKFRGQIEVTCNENYKLVNITPRKVFMSGRDPLFSDCDVEIVITAQRILWFRKNLRFCLKQGQAHMDKRPLVAGQTLTIRPGRHVLTSAKSNLSLNLHVI